MRNKNSSEHHRKVKIGGIEQKVCMAKIRNFAEIAPNLPFTEYDFYEEYRGAFEKTELGRMKKILPLHEMAESFSLVSKRMAPKRGRRGGADVPEDEDADELSETDGGAERERVLPDVL